jgi:hypothetical protein
MKKYILATSVFIAATFSGCSDFGDTNVSPNASPTPLTSALLTNSITLIVPTSTAVTVLPGLYGQYFSETLYTDASRYSVQDVNWTELSGSIFDLQNIIDINTDPKTAAYAALQGSKNNQIAIARILKAYRFSLLTDRYGDMPYFEALKQNPQPKYDTQEDIYHDLFKELKEAAAQFDEGPAAKGDILFGGDKAKWQKFANSYRLILAMRLSNVDPTYGAAQFIDALNSPGGVFSSVADDVNLTYTGNSVAFSNPWFGISGDYSISTTIVDFLVDHNDNRANAFGKPVNGTLTGVDYGLQRQDAIAYAANHSGITLILNDGLRDKTSTLSLLTYGDVLLAQAEAAERGWIPGGSATADQLYYDGIKAAWQHWDAVKYPSTMKVSDIPVIFDQTSYNNYIADPDIALTTNRAEKIATQRWLSFFPNAMQGWSEWRRTGFPKLDPSPSPVNSSGEIPVRYIYPTVEYALNKANLEEAVGRLDDGDTQDSHVWWDK